MRAGPGQYTLRCGNEFFIPLVTQATRTMTFRLPPGQWIDYWNEQRVVSGLLRNESVPLGREPVFIRQGAIIPMEVERDYTGHGSRDSAGSLTVLVYPNGTSTFDHYYDVTGQWMTLSSTLSEGTLTLGASPAPSRTLLYRVSRMNSKPDAVRVEGGAVYVNQDGGLPESGSEAEVNRSSVPAWFYDAVARRLIVKVPR